MSASSLCLPQRFMSTWSVCQPILPENTFRGINWYHLKPFKVNVLFLLSLCLSQSVCQPILLENTCRGNNCFHPKPFKVNVKFLFLKNMPMLNNKSSICQPQVYSFLKGQIEVHVNLYYLKWQIERILIIMATIGSK